MKLFVKNLAGNKSNLFINLLSLSSAFSAFIFIMLFTINEFNFDKFNVNGNRIYRIEENKDIQVPLAVSRLSKEEFPEIENSVVVKTFNNQWIRYEEDFYEINDFCFAENSFFEIFSIPFILGNPRTALEAPYSIVLSESLSEKIFGDKNPLGQTINFKNQDDYTVTGVIKDLPDFHLPAKAVASFKSVEERYGLSIENWSWSLVSYLMMEQQRDVSSLEQKMDTRFRNIDKWGTKEPDFHLRPFQEIYLATDTTANDETKHGNLYLLILLVVIGILIILISSVNYINLSLSHGLKSIPAVYIRRVLGGSKRSIIVLFIRDSILICVISAIIAIVIVILLSDFYKNLIEKELNIGALLNFKFVICIFSGAVILGILYGFFPAQVLIKTTSRQTIQNNLDAKKKSGLNVGLITFQYIVSIVLICGTIITYKQLNFSRQSDIGLDKTDALSIDLVPPVKERLDHFKEKLLANPNIKQVSFCSDDITQMNQYSTVLELNDERHVFNMAVVDPEFFPLMDIRILEGSNFSWDMQSQKDKNYIINEAAWDIIKHATNREEAYRLQGRDLLGVVENFHFQSFHNQASPMIFFWGNNDYHHRALVKFSPGDHTQTITYIKELYKSLAPGSLFKYRFVEDEFDALYNAEETLVKLLSVFTVLALFLASLGIISLSSLSAENRTKEIGIRKVNGAKVWEVLALLNKDFVKWVVIAFVIATPIAWYVMDKWLQNFAYKTELNWWIFALAGVLALGIALLTVSWQSWKAATRNPVEALRYE